MHNFAREFTIVRQLFMDVTYGSLALEYSAVFADSPEAFGDGPEVAAHSLWWMELESSCTNLRYQE